MNLVGNAAKRPGLAFRNQPTTTLDSRSVGVLSAQARKSRARPSKRTAAVRCASGHLVGGGHFGLGGFARQRIVGAFIKLPDAVAIETLLFYLKVSA